MHIKVYTKMRYSNPCGIAKAGGPGTGSKQERRRQANELLRIIERIKSP